MASEILQQKACSTCHQIQNLENFSRAKETKDGYRGQCRRCSSAYQQTPEFKAQHREFKLRVKYGITSDEYNSMLVAQNGRCAICGTADPKGRWNRFHVDHCHDSGKVRGLLCNPCNRALAVFGDNLKGLMKAVRYLQKSEQ